MRLYDAANGSMRHGNTRRSALAEQSRSKADRRAFLAMNTVTRVTFGYAQPVKTALGEMQEWWVVLLTDRLVPAAANFHATPSPRAAPRVQIQM